MPLYHAASARGPANSAPNTRVYSSTSLHGFHRVSSPPKHIANPEILD